MLINPLNAELNPICHLLELLGAHHILHVSRVRVKTHTLTPCESIRQTDAELLRAQVYAVCRAAITWSVWLTLTFIRLSFFHIIVKLMSVLTVYVQLLQL